MEMQKARDIPRFFYVAEKREFHKIR